MEHPVSRTLAILTLLSLLRSSVFYAYTIKVGRVLEAVFQVHFSKDLLLAVKPVLQTKMETGYYLKLISLFHEFEWANVVLS